MPFPGIRKLLGGNQAADCKMVLKQASSEVSPQTNES